MAVMPASPRHIVISGNIGSGKTTLGIKLANHFGWHLQLEEPERNPYLKDFYDDMHRWGFHVQVHFLISRFRQLIALREISGTVVQDRSIYEDALIFATNLYESGFMEPRDFKSYEELYSCIIKEVRQPDLLIYLRCGIEKVQQQIARRARPYETEIPKEYLENLNCRYENWITQYTGNLLILDVDNLDFVHSEKDWLLVLRKVKEAIPNIY